MQFYEKLDCLMKLTDLSNSELSKRTNIDPSLISRWRRGIKAPVVFSDTLNRVAEVLARRINNDLRRREFAARLGLGAGAPDGDGAIAAAILEWFRQSTPEQGAKPRKLSGRRPYPSYEQRQTSPLDPYSLPDAHRFGPEGRKQALSWVLSFVEYWTPGNGTLRFYTDQPLEYLDIDCSYYENRFRERAYAEKFRIVKILQPITATEQERLRALQFANLFMNTATVSIAFIERREVSIFQHSLGIYDNQMAICSYGFYGSRYTSSYVHMDESFVHELTNDFDTHFDSAQIALQPNIRFTLQDMYHTLAHFYGDREDLYYAGAQLFLPFLPPQLLRFCSRRFEDLPSLQEKARREGENFRAFLRTHKVFATFPLLSPEDCRHPDTAPYLFTEKQCKITFSQEQYRAIVQHVLDLYRSCENLELSFLPMDPDIQLWSNSHRMLYSWLGSGNRFVPYQSSHPTLIQPLHHIQSVFFHAHGKQTTRAQTEQLLCDALRRFGETT